jgi:hypothetical protein
MIPPIGVTIKDFINCTDPLVMDQSRRGVPRKYYKSPDASLVIKPGVIVRNRGSYHYRNGERFFVCLGVRRYEGSMLNTKCVQGLFERPATIEEYNKFMDDEHPFVKSWRLNEWFMGINESGQLVERRIQNTSEVQRLSAEELKHYKQQIGEEHMAEVTVNEWKEADQEVISITSGRTELTFTLSEAAQLLTQLPEAIEKYKVARMDHVTNEIKNLNDTLKALKALPTQTTPAKRPTTKTK